MAACTTPASPTCGATGWGSEEPGTAQWTAPSRALYVAPRPVCMPRERSLSPMPCTRPDSGTGTHCGAVRRAPHGSAGAMGASPRGLPPAWPSRWIPAFPVHPGGSLSPMPCTQPDSGTGTYCGAVSRAPHESAGAMGASPRGLPPAWPSRWILAFPVHPGRSLSPMPCTRPGSGTGTHCGAVSRAPHESAGAMGASPRVPVPAYPAGTSAR